MKITMKSKDIKKFAKSLRSLATKQIPFSASKALNDTMFDVYRAEGKALGKFIDRPRPFTTKAYRVIKANKRKLVAYLKTKQIQEGYLQWAVYGGQRAPKKTANVVPVEQRLNQYGNMPRGAVKKMLADKQRYFSGVPRGQDIAGIWRSSNKYTPKVKRKGKTTPNKPRYAKLRLMVAYEGAVDYDKRLPFYEIANATVRRVFRRRIMIANAYAMKTAR